MRKSRFYLLLCMIILLGLVLNGCNFGRYAVQGRIVDANGNGIPGIQILVSGGVSATTQTDQAGYWSVTDLQGQVTIRPVSRDWVFQMQQVVLSKKPDNEIVFTGSQGFTLTMNVEGPGTVTVHSEKERYEPGDIVTIFPTPDENAVFSHWKGSIGEDTNPKTLVMNNSKSITAVFVDKSIVITFEDSNLEKAVRENLEKPYGVLIEDEVETIERLDASVRNINSLEGISALKNLTWLDLSITGLEDLSSLETLSQLQYLNVSHNMISQVNDSDLIMLENLQILDLSYNSIEDLAAFRWLPDTLTELNLAGNRIRSLRPLSNLVNLESLNLNENLITNLSDLTNLTNLRELELEGNQISNLGEVFKSLQMLEKVDLGNNRLTDVSNLSWLINEHLLELDLSNNQISDFLPIEGLVTLEKLNLEKTNLTSAAYLEELVNLQELNLSENQIDDITPLANMAVLEKLWLNDNLLTNIDTLEDLLGLKWVTLMDNEDLNLSKGAQAEVIIQSLIARGAEVYYDFYHNDAPVVTEIVPITVNETEEINFEIQARDPNGDELTYVMDSADLDLSDKFDATLHAFSWTTGYEDAGVYNMTYSVMDQDVAVSNDLVITVLNVNRLPVFAPIEDQEVDEAEELTFTISATDADLQELTYSASSPDLDVSDKFDPDTQTFTWTPTYDESGVYPVTFNVTDGEDVVSETIQITVNHVNRPPVLEEIGDKVVFETELLDFTIEATDPDGDSLEFTAESTDLPLEDKFNTETGNFHWLTNYSDAGVYHVTFTISDGLLSVSESVVITVTNEDRPPVLNAIGDKTLDEYSELAFQVFAEDPDGETVTYSVQGLPAQTLDAETGDFSWTPTIEDIGDHIVTFRAESGGLTDSETITITVNNVEFAPVLEEIGDQNIDENQSLRIVLNAYDLDKDDLTYMAESEDLDLADKWDEATHTFSWTPGYDDSGVYQVTFTVDDGDQVAVEVVTITVNHVNRPPVLEPIGPKTIQENEILTFDITASDPDVEDGVLLYSAEGDLTEHFDSTGLRFNWETDYESEGVYRITFIVSDGELTDQEEVLITVMKDDRPPVLEPIGDKETNDNELLAFTIHATDADGDNITYSMTLPTATLDANTGEFSWTPSNAEIGEHQVTFRATADGTTVEETITITVIDINHPPVLNPIGNREIMEGQPLTINVNATDVDGDILTYEAFGDLAAYFDPDTKVFSWTPDYQAAKDVPNGEYMVTFVVDDGNGMVADEEVTVKVYDVDVAPTLADIPDRTINVGETMTVEMDADDPDGDPVLLSVDHNLSGVSFNPLTGIFEWTPTRDDIGTHQIIFKAEANGKETTDRVEVQVDGARLEITHMAISDSIIEDDETTPIQVTIRVENTGNIPSGNYDIVWELYQGSAKFIGLGTTTHFSIEAGGMDEFSETFTDDILLLDHGEDWRVYATVDPSETKGGPDQEFVQFTRILPQYSLSTTASQGGLIEVSPEESDYTEGTDVTLTAIPNEGYVFTGWGGDLGGAANPITITMDADKSITASFVPVALPNKLAYISKRGNINGDIYMMNTNGTVTSMTSSADIIENNPQWSPDGTKLLYEGKANGNWDIYMTNADGLIGNYRRLTSTTGADISPHWASDSTAFYFSSERDFNIYLFPNVNGNTTARVTMNVGMEYEPILSPEEEHLAFIFNNQIYIKKLDAMDNFPLVKTGNVEKNLQWSPDGTYIAYEGTDGNIWVFHWINRYTLGEAIQVTSDPAADYSPIWSPDGTKLVFVSERTGNADIWMLPTANIEDADPSLSMVLLTDSEGNDTEPNFNSFGTHLAFVSDRDGNKEVYLMNADGTNEIRLTNNPAEDHSPRWKP